MFPSLISTHEHSLPLRPSSPLSSNASFICAAQTRPRLIGRWILPADHPPAQKEHSASFIPPSPTLKSPSPPPYTGPSWSTFIALDCRGLEITGYHFSGRWVCKGAESGTPFEFELESEEGGGGRGEEVRWDDYDEKAGEAVGVSELKSKIERF